MSILERPAAADSLAEHLARESAADAPPIEQILALADADRVAMPDVIAHVVSPQGLRGPRPIGDTAHAAAVMERYADDARHMAEAEAAYAARRAVLDEWIEDERRRFAAAEAWHQHRLNAYHARRFDVDGKATIKLPHGALTSRAVTTPKLIVEDEDAAVAWADEHAPALVRTKKEFAVADAKEALTLDRSGAVVSADGEIVPGLKAIVPAPDERSYKAKPSTR